LAQGLCGEKVAASVPGRDWSRPTAPSMAEGGRRTIPEVIDALGFGPAQLVALLLGGGVWLADGAELLLIGSVTRAVSDDWSLSGFQRGLVVSVVFIGVLFGNAISGSLGDNYGRRLPIVSSYAGILIFSLLSALSWDIWSMVCFRILVGMSFGVGQPAWNTLGTELSPTDWRIVLNGLGQIFFVVGELYGAILIWSEDDQMVDLNWRRLLALGAIPSGIIGAVAYLYLLESPQLLAAKNRVSEAKDVLAQMRAYNGADTVSIEFHHAPRSEAERDEHGSFYYHMKVVFGRHLGFTTLVTCVTTFALNFNFYGGLYAFPQVLPELNLKFSPAANLTGRLHLELPGFLLGMWIGNRMTRKNGILVYLVCSALSVFIFLYGVGAFSAAHHEWATMLGFLGVKAFVDTGFVVAYMYASEIYPSVARTSGTAVCIAAGRVGAICCPLVYEYSVEATGSFHMFFGAIAVLSVLNAALVQLLEIETAGKHLADVLETEPLKP